MLRGYQDRTFCLGKSEELKISFKDEKGSPLSLNGYSNARITLVNINNELKRELVTTSNIDVIGGILVLNFTMPSFDENDDFFKKADDDIYGRGELYHAYSVSLDKDFQSYCVLRGKARLVKV